MDITDISPALNQLTQHLDQLETDLSPLLRDLSSVSSKLPLLDKAKLYAVTSYAIESLLFSSLRLNGVDAKSHAIFAELTRVRQYFDKIKKIEEPAPQREATVDTQAAIRFIRSDLADNKEVGSKLAEQLAKERAKAAIKAARAGKKRAAGDADGSGPGPAGQSKKTEGGRSKRSKRNGLEAR